MTIGTPRLSQLIKYTQSNTARLGFLLLPEIWNADDVATEDIEFVQRAVDKMVKRLCELKQRCAMMMSPNNEIFLSNVEKDGHFA